MANRRELVFALELLDKTSLFVFLVRNSWNLPGLLVQYCADGEKHDDAPLKMRFTNIAHKDRINHFPNRVMTLNCASGIIMTRMMKIYAPGEWPFSMNMISRKSHVGIATRLGRNDRMSNCKRTGL